MREVDDDAATGTACLYPPDGAGQRDTFGGVHTDTVCDCRPPRAGLDPMSEDVFDEIRAIPPTQAMRNPVNGSDGEHARGSLRHHDPPDHSLALTSGIPPAPAVHGVEYPTSAGRRHRAGPIRGVEARRIHSRPTGDLPKGERAGPAGVTRWGVPGTIPRGAIPRHTPERRSAIRTNVRMAVVNHWGPTVSTHGWSLVSRTASGGRPRAADNRPSPVTAHGSHRSRAPQRPPRTPIPRPPS